MSFNVINSNIVNYSKKIHGNHNHTKDFTSNLKLLGLDLDCVV